MCSDRLQSEFLLHVTQAYLTAWPFVFIGPKQPEYQLYISCELATDVSVGVCVCLCSIQTLTQKLLFLLFFPSSLSSFQSRLFMFLTSKVMKPTKFNYFICAKKLTTNWQLLLSFHWLCMTTPLKFTAWTYNNSCSIWFNIFDFLLSFYYIFLFFQPYLTALCRLADVVCSVVMDILQLSPWQLSKLDFLKRTMRCDLKLQKMLVRRHWVIYFFT